MNTSRPRQNGRHFADDIFKCIFLNEDVWNAIKISLKFVPKVRINNIPALVQIMAWRRPGDKPLAEPMMVSLLTHICVTRPQWVKGVSQRAILITTKEGGWLLRMISWKNILATSRTRVELIRRAGRPVFVRTALGHLAAAGYRPRHPDLCPKQTPDYRCHRRMLADRPPNWNH